MNTFELLSLTIGILTASILVTQVGLALKAIKADHERRKKQATIEFVQKIRPMWIEARSAIEERWGKEPLTSKELEEIAGNYLLLKTVRDLLGTLEHLSVGVNTGVFDKDILFRMSGTLFVNIHKRLHSYIDRAQTKQPTAYSEYQKLVNNFERMKRLQPTKNGDIINS